MTDPQPSDASLLDAMTDGVYVTDRNRRITYWNAAAGEIAGYGSDEAVGRFCGDGLLNHVDEQGQLLCGARCPLKATIEDGRKRTTHAYLHHKAGRLVPVRISAAPLRDDQSTIIGAVETFADDSARAETSHRLRTAEELAMQDPLTRLGNRRHLDVELDRRLAQWRRHDHRFAVLVVDVDNFKAVNDVHGHPAGDHVLTVIGHGLAHAVRATDAVFRYGGDEFVVLAGPITAEEVAPLSDRIQRIMRDNRDAVPGRPTVTISVGGALVAAGDGTADVIERADRRLLRAKSMGGNRTVLGDDDQAGVTNRQPLAM